MTDGESYAYPKHGQASNGLTKREAFAMAAIEGSARHLVGALPDEVQRWADTAVKLADALVSALNSDLHSAPTTTSPIGKVLVSQDRLNALQFAGTMLSNAAYNLKQQQEIRPEWRRSLEEGQKKWDSEVSALNQEIAF